MTPTPSEALTQEEIDTMRGQFEDGEYDFKSALKLCDMAEAYIKPRGAVIDDVLAQSLKALNPIVPLMLVMQKALVGKFGEGEVGRRLQDVRDAIKAITDYRTHANTGAVGGERVPLPPINPKEACAVVIDCLAQQNEKLAWAIFNPRDEFIYIGGEYAVYRLRDDEWGRIDKVYSESLIEEVRKLVEQRTTPTPEGMRSAESWIEKAREVFPGNPSARLGFGHGVKWALEIFGCKIHFNPPATEDDV